jgi:tetratricopeptide (TPR) repeat protein
MGACATTTVGGQTRNGKGILVNIEQAQQRLKDGIACSDKEDFDGAIAIFTEIIDKTKKISPESKAQVHIQRGRCHWEMRRFEEAAKNFEKARELLPDNADANWTLCLIYLQMNRFDEGWKYQDWRWKTPKFDSPRLKTSKPQWTKDCGAKRVLVWSEQGIGDQILHMSLLHNIQELSEQVMLMADVRLFPVLERSFPGVQLIAQNERVKGFDAQIPLASIGSQFIHSLDDIEKYSARSYLKPNSEKVEKLRQSIRRPGERLIGLSWHSGAPRIGNHKSVKLAELMPLFKLPNTKFVSLQYGDCYEDLYELEKQYGIKVGIIPAIDNKDDIDGLTSLMAACDAVVTVSNATGHFAGALGMPTYVLNGNKLWYWSNVRGTQSVWYPSANVYARENVLAPWAKQINQVIEDLK